MDFIYKNSGLFIILLVLLPYFVLVARFSLTMFKDKKYWKYFTFYLPILSLNVIAGALVWYTTLGYPKYGYPPNEIKFISFTYDQNEQTMYVWGIKKGENTPKSYRFPYKHSTHKTLEEARRAKKKGIGTKLYYDEKTKKIKIRKIQQKMKKVLDND